MRSLLIAFVVILVVAVASPISQPDGFPVVKTTAPNDDITCKRSASIASNDDTPINNPISNDDSNAAELAADIAFVTEMETKSPSTVKTRHLMMESASSTNQLALINHLLKQTVVYAEGVILGAKSAATQGQLDALEVLFKRLELHQRIGPVQSAVTHGRFDALGVMIQHDPALALEAYEEAAKSNRIDVMRHLQVWAETHGFPLLECSAIVAASRSGHSDVIGHILSRCIPSTDDANEAYAYAHGPSRDVIRHQLEPYAVLSDDIKMLFHTIGDGDWMALHDIFATSLDLVNDNLSDLIMYAVQEERYDVIVHFVSRGFEISPKLRYHVLSFGMRKNVDLVARMIYGRFDTVWLEPALALRALSDCENNFDGECDMAAYLLLCASVKCDDAVDWAAKEYPVAFASGLDRAIKAAQKEHLDLISARLIKLAHALHGPSRPICES
jgi:hypothetical protein